MAGDLVWAVTDGPGGTGVVDLPHDRWQAIRLREQHKGNFWCSTEASGCGGGLILAAGPILIPHFRHRADARCEFIGSASKAGPAYEHLRYQRALLRWLEGQGYSPVLEKTLGPDGRTDLHVLVESVRHAIEVQLSPLPSGAWRERDGKYRRHHEHVTWLYGPTAEAAAATELGVRGVAFALRPGPTVGVRDVDSETHWAELTQCRLTLEGLYVPGLQEARSLHRLRRAEAEKALRLAQEAEAETKRLADSQREERERLQAAMRAERERRTEESRAKLPLFRLNHDPSLEGLERWEGRYPESSVWEPAIGWGWLTQLPDELHRPARALAYCTQVLTYASTVAHLLPGVLADTDRNQILTLLEDLSLIKIQWLRPDLERWERTSG